MDTGRRIDEWTASHVGEMKADIAKLVSIRSVVGEAEPGAPFGKGPAAALDRAIEMCRGMGFAVRDYDHAAACASFGEGERLLDMLAHLDVVDVGEGWETDPFELVERDGMLYGRGVSDDKGPLVIALYAMRCVKELGLPLKGSVGLIMGTDEESGMRDLPHYFAVEKNAPNTFSPDADFPLYNVEKGHMHGFFSAAWDEQTALPRVESFSGGFRFNVLPADAEAVVLGLDEKTVREVCEKEAPRLRVTYAAEPAEGGVKLSVSGLSCHASVPETGVNGITALAELLSALPLADCPSTRAVRSIAKLFPAADCNGAALGVDMADEVSGRLTMVLSILKLDGAGVECTLDSRMPICATEDNCVKPVLAKLENEGFSAKADFSAPHNTPGEGEFVRTLLRCYEEVTGEEGRCCYTGGGTYVHDIEGGVAFGPTFPGFESNIHGNNERMSVEDALKAVRIYARAIAAICGK